MHLGNRRAGGALTAVLIAGLLLAINAQAGATTTATPVEASGKASNTYGMANEFVKNFGYTDRLEGVKKPKKYGLAVTSFILMEAKKLKKWKNWGSKKTVAKAKKMKICDPQALRCTESTKKKKGKLTLKSPRTTTCEINGKMKKVHLYLKVVAKIKGKGKKGTFKAQFDSTNPKDPPPDCPSF